MGLENRIVFNIVDVIKGVCKPQQSVIKSKRSTNLFLLPASQTDDKNVVAPEEMKELINKYKGEYNYILIDSPAGIEQGFKNACAAADQAIVVTTPEVSAIRDADRVIGLLASESIDALLLINRVDKDLVRRGDMLSPQDVIDILGIEQIGLIFRDNDIVVSANSGDPVVYNPKSKAGKAFIDIAERLNGANIPITDLDIGTSLWARIGRKLRAA
jgi:septum site-determining protein MinD